MNLQEASAAAIALTGELQDALAAEDLALCAALLLRRADAMVAFADCHRAAGPRERAEARELILALREQDRCLQAQAADLFALAERSFRAQLGAQPAGAAAYGALACLDHRG